MWLSELIILRIESSKLIKIVNNFIIKGVNIIFNCMDFQFKLMKYRRVNLDSPDLIFKNILCYIFYLFHNGAGSMFYAVFRNYEKNWKRD